MRILLNLAPVKSSTPNGKKWLKPSKLLALVVREALEALIMANRLYLRTHRVPALYESGVRYEEEPAGQPYEDFSAIPVVLARGWGDCDDVVSWRIAELRNSGENAKVRLKWDYDPARGARMYHVLVRRANGQVEDPSKRLDMGNHKAAKAVTRFTP
jgi:hypothetical protein